MDAKKDKAGAAGAPTGKAAVAKEREQDGFWEILKTVVYAVLIALVVRTVLVEPFSIPSKSMVPTLLVNDYLFVSKFSYGYSRYSLPLALPVFGDGRIFESQPERGDVAVFKKPHDEGTDYIKRIIGLPGDRIQVKNGILHINGEAVERRRIGDFSDRTFSGREERLIQYVETLPSGESHLIVESEGDRQPYLSADGRPVANPDNTDVYVVPEGHYFAMGDNRDRSQDSRFLSAVGYIPAANLVGRAEFIFFSVDEDGAWWQLWRWPWIIRFDRIFQGIQ